MIKMRLHIYFLMHELIGHGYIFLSYRYVFEDQIEFIKANVMDGENVCLPPSFQNAQTLCYCDLYMTFISSHAV